MSMALLLCVLVHVVITAVTSICLNKGTYDYIPISTFSCTGETAASRRCWVKNVFIVDGTIWLISKSNNSVEAPSVLCSAVDRPERFYYLCKFYIRNQNNASNELFRLGGINATDTKTILCFKSYDTGIVFGRLVPSNPYHVIFEEAVPLFEMMDREKALKGWIHKDKMNTKKLLVLQDNIPFLAETGHGAQYYSLDFWRTFFPNLDVFSVTRTTKSPDVRFVHHLVIGANNSCSHSEHCSRASFVTPNIAVKFRNHIIKKIYKGKTKRKRKRTPTVTIIQRKGSRQIRNIDELQYLISRVANVTAKVIDYAQMGLKEQYQITHETDILIMVHGGALGNLLFLPKHATLLDIYPYGYPFAWHQLVSWAREEIESLRIAHAPFESISGSDLYYNYYNESLPMPPNCYFTKDVGTTRLFWPVNSIQIDTLRFEPFFSDLVKNWLNGTNYNPPVKKVDFVEPKVPWYYEIIRQNNPGMEEQMCINPWVTFHHRISITSDVKTGQSVSGTWFNLDGSYEEDDWIGVYPASNYVDDPSNITNTLLWWTYVNGNGATTGNFTTDWVVPNDYEAFRIYLFEGGYNVMARSQTFTAAKLSKGKQP